MPGNSQPFFSRPRRFVTTLPAMFRRSSIGGAIADVPTNLARGMLFVLLVICGYAGRIPPPVKPFGRSCARWWKNACTPTRVGGSNDFPTWWPNGTPRTATTTGSLSDRNVLSEAIRYMSAADVAKLERTAPTSISSSSAAVESGARREETLESASNRSASTGPWWKNAANSWNNSPRREFPTRPKACRST